MVKVKNLWDAVEEFLKESNIDLSYVDYYKAWPVISGMNLSSCTKLTSLKDLEKKKIYVSATSLSAKSLLKLEERNVIKRWNEIFPDKKIDKIVIVSSRP